MPSATTTRTLRSRPRSAPPPRAACALPARRIAPAHAALVALTALTTFAACGDGMVTGPAGSPDARYDDASAGSDGPDAPTSFDATSQSDARDGAAPADAPHDVTTPPPACTPLPPATYDRVSILGPPGTDTPAAMHPDVNLLFRSWTPAPASETRGLIRLDHPLDPAGMDAPPRLASLFLDERIPAFSQVYQVQNWQWGCHCFTGYVTSPPVTLAGFVTTPGEVLRVPRAGRLIDPPDFSAMVLYAAPNTITLKYTLEDTAATGYTVHLAGVCVDPALVSAYDAANAAGRRQLPALHMGQAFGRAAGAEVQLAIRDTGSWMDPRWCLDWWPRCP